MIRHPMDWLIARLRKTSVGALAGGLVLIAIGLFAGYTASSYSIGELRSFGPGFFPLVVAGMMVAFGLAVILENHPIDRDFDPPSARSIICICLSLVAFGLLIRPFGAVIATVVLVVIAAVAQDRFRALSTIITAVVLAAFMYGVFVYAFRMPISAWPDATAIQRLITNGSL